MKKSIALGLLTLSILLRPAFASADSLTYSSLGNGSWVTLQLGSVTETGWAGEIKWLYQTTSNPIGTLVTTYCADLFDDAKLPTQTVTTTTTTALDASIAAGTSMSINATAHAGAKAAYLVDTYAASAHGSNDLAAGLQIAIWQAMFGSASFTYTAGAGVITAANTYYGNLMSALAANPTGVYGYTARYFDVANDASHTLWNAYGQDQIDPIVGSPEPSTVFLLLFAMAAGFGYHYRMSRRTIVAVRQIRS
jgi:hypothetical protein